MITVDIGPQFNWPNAMITWCEKEFGPWIYGLAPSTTAWCITNGQQSMTFRFKNKDDATRFKMHWGRQIR